VRSNREKISGLVAGGGKTIQRKNAGYIPMRNEEKEKRKSRFLVIMPLIVISFKSLVVINRVQALNEN
jgi:hypothetical protein